MVNRLYALSKDMYTVPSSENMHHVPRHAATVVMASAMGGPSQSLSRMELLSIIIWMREFLD